MLAMLCIKPMQKYDTRNVVDDKFYKPLFNYDKHQYTPGTHNMQIKFVAYNQ